MRFYFHDFAYHELPDGVDLPDGAVEVPRLPEQWEVWDGAAFVASEGAVQAINVEIDRQAEQIRAGIITTGSGQAMTYLRKEAEARAWLDDNNTPAPFVEAEASVTGRTVAELAQIIVNQADAWLIVGPRIEAARIAAKQAVRDATTVSKMQAAAAIDWQAVVTGQGV